VHLTPFEINPGKSEIIWALIDNSSIKVKSRGEDLFFEENH